MSHDPDHVLPFENYTVSEFIQEYGLLKTQNEHPEEHDSIINSIDFVLTGRHPNRRTQAVVNPLTNRLHQGAIPTIRRDYDSLISFTTHIPILTSIYVYPIARLEDTLTSNLHIRVPFPIYHGRVSFPNNADLALTDLFVYRKMFL